MRHSRADRAMDRHAAGERTSQHPEALNLWDQKGSPVGTDLNQI
jgi:hypothetical protein